MLKMFRFVQKGQQKILIREGEKKCQPQIRNSQKMLIEFVILKRLV